MLCGIPHLEHLLTRVLQRILKIRESGSPSAEIAGRYGNSRQTAFGQLNPATVGGHCRPTRHENGRRNRNFKLAVRVISVAQAQAASTGGKSSRRNGTIPPFFHPELLPRRDFRKVRPGIALPARSRRVIISRPSTSMNFHAAPSQRRVGPWRSFRRLRRSACGN